MSVLRVDNSTAGQFIPRDNFAANERTSTSLPGFESFLFNLTQWVHWENHADEIRRHRKWVRALMYYEGRQLGRVSVDGNWRDVNPLPNDPFYVDNKYRFHAKSVRKEWVRSAGEYMARARGSSTEYEAAARGGKAVLITEQQRLLDPFKLRREANFAILTGNYFRYTWIDSTQGQQIQIPQFETQPMMVGQQGYYCADCDQEGYVDPMSAEANEPMPLDEMSCPQCGSPNVMPVGGEMVNMPVQTGTIPTRAGQLVCEIVDPMECKMHLHARSFEESPYFRRRRLILKDVIEDAYPWVRSSGSGYSNLETNFWYQNQLERSAGNISGSGGYLYSSSGGVLDRYDRLVEFNQYWWEPVMYRNYVFEEDLVLASGQTVPAGEKLGDIFPDGLYVAMVGQRAIVDMRNEAKNKHWVHGVYDCISTRVWGDGNDDAIEQQRQRNEVTSLLLENIMNCAGQSAIFNPLKISRSEYSGKPREMVPLKNPTLADEPAKYVYSPPPRPLGPEPPMYIQMLDQSMQSAFGSFSSNAGLPDANNKTATGISIVKGSTDALLADPLELRSNVDLKQGYQIMHLVQEHAQMPGVADLYLPTLGDHGQYEWDAFLRCDIDTQIQITVRKGSWIPRDEDQLRNDMIEALTAGGIPGGVYSPAFPPDARLETMKRFNIPWDTDKQQVDTRRQYIEIQKILQVVGQALQEQQQMMADPMAQMEMDQAASTASPEEAMMMQAAMDPSMIALQQVPVEPLIDEHIFHIEEIKRWLKTDLGDQLAPVGSPERNAIMMHLQAHMEAQMMQAMQQAAMMGMPQGQEGQGDNQKPKGKGSKPPNKETQQ